MNLQKIGKAGLDQGFLQKAIIGIILFVVIVELYAVLVPTAQTSGTTLSNSGVPLGSLFGSGGVVFVIIMAALVIAVIFSFMKMKRR